MARQLLNTPSVRFTWLIHYACNYRCAYCFYYEGSGWEILKDKNTYLSSDEWIRHWENIYAKYGRCVIIITGGEPFIYPDFIELISRLSQIHHPINISSNASGDLESFVKQVDPTRVSLSASFQPEFEKLDVFLDKLVFLREHKFNGCVNLVAYPPFLKDLEFYRNRFRSVNEDLKIIPFRGIYKEQAYPWSYTNDGLRLMGIEKSWFSKIRRKGDSCVAGKDTALLLPDGNVVRCGQMFYRFIVGNFFDTDFKLLVEQMPCETEVCPCGEDIVLPEIGG